MSRAERRRAQVQAEVHAALAEFAAAVEVRLHAELAQNRRTQVELIHALQAMRLDLAGRDGEITRAIDTAGAAVQQASAHIAQEQVDRRALIEAVGGLTEAVTGRAITMPELPPLLTPHAVGPGNGYANATRGDNGLVPHGERIVGGRVAGPAASNGSPTNDTDAPPTKFGDAANGAATADAAREIEGTAEIETVECLVDGHWEDGYEVVQVLQAGDVRQYKVRRADGSILDHLLDPGEVRHPQRTPVPAGSGRPAVYWTRS